MLGILGLGSQSTVYYIQKLNELYNELHGGFSTMPFKLLNVNFDLINSFLPNQFDKLFPVIELSLTQLDNLGVNKIIIPNITLHEAIDKSFLSKDIKIKIVHPFSILENETFFKDFQDVCVLGTAFTMQNPYILNKLKRKIKTLSQAEVELIDNIRKSVYEGNGESEKHLRFFQQLMSNNPKTLFIIACTELSVLINNVGYSSQILDLAGQQIMHCI